MMVIDLEYMAMVLARQISTVVEVRRGRQRRRQARIASVHVNTRPPISHPSRSHPVQSMNGLTRSGLRQICSSAVVAGTDEALTSSAPNASAQRVLPRALRMKTRRIHLTSLRVTPDTVLLGTAYES